MFENTSHERQKAFTLMNWVNAGPKSHYSKRETKNEACFARYLRNTAIYFRQELLAREPQSVARTRIDYIGLVTE